MHTLNPKPPKKQRLIRHDVQTCSDCAKGKAWRRRSEGLVVVTGLGPVSEHLADVAVGPRLPLAAVVGAVWRRVGLLRLCGAVLRVVEVKAVADVAEQSRGDLLLCVLGLHTGKEKALRV